MIRNRGLMTTASGTLGGSIAALPPNNIACLVVEDNEINQRVATSFLKRLGIATIDMANNGEEALRLARERHYDIILMDIMMPIMDGLQSTKCIRAETGPNQRTVIVAVTAMGPRTFPLSETGINDYLCKPFTKVQLEQMVKKWVMDPAASLPLATKPENSAEPLSDNDAKRVSESDSIAASPAPPSKAHIPK